MVVNPGGIFGPPSSPEEGVPPHLERRGRSGSAAGVFSLFVGILMEAVPACVLGMVHGDVRILDEGVRIGTVVGEEGHSDAGRDLYFQPVELKRLVERMEDPFGHILGHLRLTDLGEEQDEFVPSPAGDGVSLAEHVEQPVGHALEQLVADIMSVGIVDFLEFVQVEHKDGQLLEIPLGLG